MTVVFSIKTARSRKNNKRLELATAMGKKELHIFWKSSQLPVGWTVALSKRWTQLRLKKIPDKIMVGTRNKRLPSLVVGDLTVFQARMGFSLPRDKIKEGTYITFWATSWKNRKGPHLLPSHQPLYDSRIWFGLYARELETQMAWTGSEGYLRSCRRLWFWECTFCTTALKLPAWSPCTHDGFQFSPIEVAWRRSYGKWIWSGDYHRCFCSRRVTLHMARRAVDCSNLVMMGVPRDALIQPWSLQLHSYSFKSTQSHSFSSFVPTPAKFHSFSQQSFKLCIRF